MKSRGLITTAAVALSFFLTVPFMTTTVEAGWTPKKPINFVIMAGKDGGGDKMARLMQSIIEKNKFSPCPC